MASSSRSGGSALLAKASTPANSAAERALPHGVLWRATSFGTHGPAGSRFVERVLTIRDALRQQHRHLLDYLTQACHAAWRSQPAAAQA